MHIRDIAVIGLLALVPLLHGCFVAAAAGVGATALMAEDRRSSGIYLEDQNIEMKLRSAIREKYSGNDQLEVNVTSYNRFVLLSGEVPSEEVKKDVGVMALGVENVRNVQNEIVIAPRASLSQSSSDTLTTSKVKSRFVTENRFQPNHVKVVTRGDVVYLMGLVTPKEADDATEIARTTGGVQKVVRVFEITENP
jgi:osmotically-inducible protein OsmY